MLTALDLFAGAGGATQGLKDAGYRVVAAVEEWSDAVRTFSANHPEVGVLERDIRCVEPRALRTSLELSVGSLDLITACPPCQSFSTLGRMDASDSRNDLIAETERFEIKRAKTKDGRVHRVSANEVTKFHDYLNQAVEVYARDEHPPQVSGIMIADGFSAPTRQRTKMEIPGVRLHYRTWARVIRETERLHRGWLAVATRRADSTERGAEH